MENLKIPKTTSEKPYIEFKFNKKGRISLSASADWWGGRSEGFYCSDGTCGNTCLPDKLDAYIKAFKARKVKEIEKEIKSLQVKLNKLNQ